MLIAKDLDNNKVLPSPKMSAICPHCEQEVLSKCGDINVWHWAHLISCPFEYERETEWHKLWKDRAVSFGLELEHMFVRHITDAIDHKKKVCYEFQYSPISRIEMVSRVIHYKTFNYSTKWIFDYKEKKDSDQLIISHVNNLVVKFQQKWAKRTITDLFEGKSILFGVIYFDTGDDIILVRKLYENGNGWGYIVTPQHILNNSLIQKNYWGQDKQLFKF